MLCLNIHCTFGTTKTNLTQLTQLMIIPRKWKLFSSNVKYKPLFQVKQELILTSL